VYNLSVYIGWDEREVAAYRKAEETLSRTSDLSACPLDIGKLRDQGVMNRPVIEKDGKMYDVISQAYQSTDFAVSRFVVPILCSTRWALFTDCDVIFLDDVTKMFEEIEPGKAVYVVKHSQMQRQTTKMDGQLQQFYARKNWSSVMLFDCEHPANRRLTLHDINSRPGRDLHKFYWLADDEIGELHRRWNWLVNVTRKPLDIGIAHFTLGGPWFDNWIPKEHDDIWLNACP
jgi:lipopolysaccharide biosynthesis glycosyltransferase